MQRPTCLHESSLRVTVLLMAHRLCLYQGSQAGRAHLTPYWLLALKTSEILIGAVTRH